MTELTKPVTRKITLLTDHRIKARSQDRVAVTLHPDGTIGFRAHRKRRAVRLPLSTVYILALREADKEARQEKKRRQLIKRGIV
jgi:hypothetical protein